MMCYKQGQKVFVKRSVSFRIMPKRGSTFSLDVEGFKFYFPGSSMLCKPAERATKKPKLKMPMDFL